MLVQQLNAQEQPETAVFFQLPAKEVTGKYIPVAVINDDVVFFGFVNVGVYEKTRNSLKASDSSIVGAPEKFQVQERWDKIVHALKEYAPERKNTVFYYDIDDTICGLTVLRTTGRAD